MKRILKRDKKGNPAKGSHPKAINLYKFIRLVLGTDIPDSKISHRWNMDQKNFHEFKIGAYPVPRLGKLEELALVLGVNKHLVFQVAGGAPAQKVFNLIKKNDLQGQARLLSNQVDAAHDALAKSEKRYRELFNNANDAIFIADIKTGYVIDCNKAAEELHQAPKDKIINRHFLTHFPSHKHKLYKDHMKKFAGQIKARTRNHEVLRPDGTTMLLSASSSVIEIDGQKYIQSICRQISAD